MDLGLFTNLLDARPDVVVSEKQPEEVRRGQLADAAMPWFDDFYPRMREQYLKDLADAPSPDAAYEIAVQVRVLEAMRINIRKDFSRLLAWKTAAQTMMEE